MPQDTPSSASSSPVRGRGLRLFTGLAFVAVALVPALATTSGGARADDSEVTVDAPAGGTVTVEKTKHMINEVIKVSWEGFQPSDYFYRPTFDEGVTRYPVRVYQCRGAAPAGPQDCYGSMIYEYSGREDELPNWDLGRPDGPANLVQTATGADGSGSVDLEILTKVESVTLGCTDTVPCSVVVVPNLGHPERRDSQYPQYPACATIYAQSDTFCTGAPYRGNVIDAPWAWDNRAVVPLSFAPAGDACEIADAQASLLGSPKTERALTSWQRATCVSDAPVDFDYTSQSESLSRNAFLAGLTDVALTHRPAPAGSVSNRTYTYAPVATSAITVAFRVDDAATYQPISEMRLNARLIAKLVTASYGYLSWSPEGADYGNPATRGNPITIFDDPEFLELNPGHTWPSGLNNSCPAPMIMADVSDLTYELTRFLDQDPDARAFLDGDPDEWGMHVNTHYEGIDYPIENFDLRDPDVPMTYVYQPVQGLNQVARKLVTNTYVGTLDVMDGSTPPKPLKCGYLNRGVEPPGTRMFVAIIDSANAAAYRFPAAAVQNAAGEFVAPTRDAMAAAVAAMTVNEDGITRTPDLGADEPAVYPLTTTDYAMVPTSGLGADTAEAVGRVLDHAAAGGQELGQRVGGLPEGYLPLSPDLAAQTVAAAAAVRAQDGAPIPTPTPTPTSTSSAPSAGGSSGLPGGSTGGAAAGPGGAGAVAVPGAPGSVTAAPTTVVAAPLAPVSAQTPAWFRVVVPLALIGGMGAALLGSTVLGVAGRGAPAAAVQRIRRLRLPGRRRAGSS